MDDYKCPKSLYVRCKKSLTCEHVPKTSDLNAAKGPYGFHYLPTYKCFRPIDKETKDAKG